MSPALPATRRRALELLADAGINGATEESLHFNGIPASTLAGLVRIGGATSTTGKVRAGGSIIEVMRFRITDAGSKALLASKSFR
jgi:hypothetical protein